MNEWQWWAIHLLPWLPPTLIAVAVLLRQAQTHKLLLQITLQLNGKDKNGKDLPATQRASEPAARTDHGRRGDST